MKAIKLIPAISAILIFVSCGTGENKITLPLTNRFRELPHIVIPIDKGFSEYISGYTSGIIPANSAIEIRFTPAFAANTGKLTSGLFEFEPAIKGKTEWKDERTLVFTPSQLLDPGKTYTGGLNIWKIASVNERLKVFPLRIQTLRKDFRVTTGALECISPEGSVFKLTGEIVASDFIDPGEVENYLDVRLGKKKIEMKWDHSRNPVHKFTIESIERSDRRKDLFISWDGKPYGVKQKGTAKVSIPAIGEFGIIDIMTSGSENQRIDIVFSDPPDASQEIVGLIHLIPETETILNVSSNIVSIIPSIRLSGPVTLNVEKSIRSKKGITLPETYSKELDFTPVPPGIMAVGNGVIIPSSQNLIFPFKAANLKSVDLKIIRIFENNLPYFLQENDINGGYSMKRFGKPVYSGKVDLIPTPGMTSGGWNQYTIDLADYIKVEPGILYKVILGMRRSYSILQGGRAGETGKYEELLQEQEVQGRSRWDDPENYYEDPDDEVYYSAGFNWEDRNDPLKDAYYSPDKKVTRNILASNFGMMAKKGSDNILHVMVSDLTTAMPLNEVSVEVYDYQMQLLVTGTTKQNGSAALLCDRKPFLVVAKKDKDRNYLKINDGSSLSLSSFDVAGITPEEGIKAFIYGERDVWRPGDSIYLSLLIRDIRGDLPQGHPVQFELINPLEQKVDNQVRKIERRNLMAFATKTSPDAVTGNYRATFRIGGALFTKRIRIETVKPNRLKIDLNFPEGILGGSKPVSHGSLNVKWLNGSVAGNVKSSVEYILKPGKTEFGNYRQYNFDDPVNEFLSETVTAFEGSVDEKGNAPVLFDPGKVNKAPGMLNVIFTTKASEPGGDESIVQTTQRYAPYPVFAGILLPGLNGKSRMLYTDKDNEVRIVTLDENGRPVRSEVEVTIYKLTYRWWWESDQENLARYIANNTFKPIIKKTFITSGGEGTFVFRIDKKEWGRYLIRATTPGGHSTGTIALIDWPWEYGMKGNNEGATLLSINTDKEKYSPGDEVNLTFPTPGNAKAIVTLENSTGVIAEIFKITDKGNTTVRFQAKHEMAPNIYAYVTVVQPHAQTVNDMPARLYGVVPILIEDPGTRLKPEIDMPDEIRSQKPFIVRVSEKNNKPMTYTLAIVDEGLLGITGFKTPDPWNYFYAREALGVQTWDLYDLVLGSYGGILERSLAIGGDETVMDRSANKAQRFKPVIKFQGPFDLGAGKSNSHAIILPQYTGSIRTMIIAGSDRAFGAAEKSALVKDPLMVLVTAPRVISPGEKLALPVTLFILKEGIKEITVKAEGNELVKAESTTLNISNTGTGEREAEFTFTAGERTGVAKIKVTAETGGEKAVYDLEIGIRSPNPPETRSEVKVIAPGEKWETTFTPLGMNGSGTSSLEVSTLPSISLDKRLDYLLEYPYGCSEQIISAAFPQLCIGEISGAESRFKTSSSGNITEAIGKLVTRQMAGGGIALWPGSSQPDNWITSYAGHFMTEAERKGYSIPSSFRQKWTDYQKKTARDWRFDTQFRQSANDQAYRLFTLALAGQSEKGAMNRLRESAGIPRLARWLLAAAYATTGRPEVAGDLLDVRNTETETDFRDYFYGSELRDKAIILYTLVLLKNKESALPLIKEICERFSSSEWHSTQSVAWGLFSYMKWAAVSGGVSNDRSDINITLNGTKTKQSIEPQMLWHEDLRIAEGKNTLIVDNISHSPLYATLTRKGIPSVSDISREEKGLEMKIEYLDRKLNPINQKVLQQGSDFIMMVRVTNGTFSDVDNIALTAMVPPGWEIQNTRMYDASWGIRESRFDYRDFRDDRVNTYFSLGRGETKTFTLILAAAYKGEFFQPPVWCEAMYTPDCYSRFPGTLVKVVAK